MIEPLSEGEVSRIAALARLGLDDAEKKQLAEQLGQILAFAGQIAAVDTSRVPAGSDWLDLPPLERADEVMPSLDRDAVLANAPEQVQGLFLAPRVLPSE